MNASAEDLTTLVNATENMLHHLNLRPKGLSRAAIDFVVKVLKGHAPTCSLRDAGEDDVEALVDLVRPITEECIDLVLAPCASNDQLRVLGGFGLRDPRQLLRLGLRWPR